MHQPGLQPGTYSPGMQPGGMEPLGGSGKGKTWIVVALVVVLVLALGGLVGVVVLRGDDDETPVADNTEETSERTDSATTEPTDSATTEPTEHPSSDTPEGLLAVGESATIGRFVLTVDEVVQDGDDVIADAMAGNPPAAGQYIVDHRRTWLPRPPPCGLATARLTRSATTSPQAAGRRASVSRSSTSPTSAGPPWTGRSSEQALYRVRILRSTNAWRTAATSGGSKKSLAVDTVARAAALYVVLGANWN